ncbi:MULTISPECIES: hypothetical protein [Pseudomonas]|nr:MULTISPECIES: hypothetical protein [Pseudomonas]UVL88211.1 hypothetical protein LOY51_20945 [Pseudomonas sichuanensis]
MIELINCSAHGPAHHHRQKRSLGDWQVNINSQVSEKDKAFMRMAYPH